MKILGEIVNDFDAVNKKYVDDCLQNDFEFKVFTQAFIATSPFDYQVTIEEGWIPYGFFTISTEGNVQFGYQSYETTLVSPTKVRCRGWANTTGVNYLKVWLPCYRKRVAKNLLAYTTRDTLWTGSFTLDNTCNLSQSWKDYDYLDFKIVDGGSRLWHRVYVSNLIEGLTNKDQQLEPKGWNSTDKRIIIFKSGTTDTALKININGNLYIQEIIGYRVVPEKDLGGSVVIKKIVTGQCDGAGYFKTSDLQRLILPAGKVLLSARPCTLSEGQNGSVWNILIEHGAQIIPLANPNNNSVNAWSISLRGWKGENNYANITNIKLEIAYA